MPKRRDKKTNLYFNFLWGSSSIASFFLKRLDRQIFILSKACVVEFIPLYLEIEREEAVRLTPSTNLKFIYVSFRGWPISLNFNYATLNVTEKKGKYFIVTLQIVATNINCYQYHLSLFLKINTIIIFNLIIKVKF